MCFVLAGDLAAAGIPEWWRSVCFLALIRRYKNTVS